MHHFWCHIFIISSWQIEKHSRELISRVIDQQQSFGSLLSPSSPQQTRSFNHLSKLLHPSDLDCPAAYPSAAPRLGPSAVHRTSAWAGRRASAWAVHRALIGDYVSYPLCQYYVSYPLCRYYVSYPLCQYYVSYPLCQYHVSYPLCQYYSRIHCANTIAVSTVPILIRQ